MRIRLTRNLGRDFPEQHQEGEEVDVTEDFGESLCRQGLAERLDGAQELRGIPPAQEIESDICEDVGHPAAKTRKAKHK